ncbi:MAG: hypothetical protein GX895_10460 [Clostridiales bacterium]|uniref:hypothetical protein n=1 Tax=Clostridium sp. N3C TaxID=1776758 RepID=UPI00092E1A15|nr:hypothetical protein [Clostridium sp. N3C]NLZ49184.1 hypothetical protein [Clostridiales bacterium]SCN25115.1 hypothetical protein N3C_2167 [Clostridium sp. N3C]
MAGNNNLSPHESLELTELLNSNLIVAKKLQANMSMVQDVDLKSYMDRCLTTKKNCIKAIQGFSGANEDNNFQNL